jgi:catechol 2,3-dioxygenase-like lactoylglutathione lyase family enzyme
VGDQRNHTFFAPVSPRINGVVETCLYSDDLPRSVRFYKDQLGLRLLESGERLCVFSVADKQVLLIFRSGGIMNPIPTPGGMIPPHEASGQLHLAFAVSKEDLTAWEKHLIDRGITIESKVSWPAGGQSIYFRDPDNHYSRTRDARNLGSLLNFVALCYLARDFAPR